MRRLVSRIQKRVPRQRLIATVPKASLGALPMLISFELGFALLAGYFAAHFFAGKKTSEPGRFPSLVFEVQDYRIHLHHWLVFLVVLVGATLFNFFLFTPFLFYGFFGGAIFQGLWHYEDWPRIVSKQKKV